MNAPGRGMSAASWVLLGLAALLSCATVVNLTVLHASPVASAGLAVLAVIILVIRRQELRARLPRKGVVAVRSPR